MATILVVDDKELNRNLLSVLLGYRGHRILEASDGTEALNKAQAENPDLVITDILMPRMDGYQLVRKLREIPATRNVKVVFYSALYREEETRSLAAACGVSEIISKPTDPEEILRIVETVLISEVKNSLQPIAEPKVDVVKLLSEKLYQKVLELESTNAGLEKAVALRTKELADSNRSLQEQIAEREKAEAGAASDREQKLKIKGDFLSNVSHDLRSPLTVVHQFVSILLDGLGGSINANQKEYLEIALRNVNQLKCMIDDLLEASRAETAKLTLKQAVISTKGVLSLAIQSFRPTAAAKGIVIHTHIPDTLPAVYADPQRTCQVITNLLDNAAKFSPAKSTITVQARILEEDPMFICISVADCGCGVDPDESEKIFERLYQVNNSVQPARRGLGLGLYICKELVRLQGGKIWNDPKRRGGATISFTLPVFSIRRLIAPIVKQGSLIDASFALIAIEVLPVKAWPSDRKREQILSNVYDVLERCILPDLDVLLPPQNRAGSAVFFVFARTDQKGSSILSSRIQKQISQSDDLALAGISCAVSTKFLNLGALERGWSLEQQIQHVASHLEEALQEEITEKEPIL